MKGQPKPTTATGWSTATIYNLLAQKKHAYNRASHDLYAILFTVTCSNARMLPVTVATDGRPGRSIQR